MCVTVDDKKILRQLANDVAAGKLNLEELKMLDLETTGRGMRRKYRPEQTDTDDQV